MSIYNSGDKVYTVGDIDRIERENAELKAQVEQLRFESACFDVDVIRCLKTLAFEHNHCDIQRYMVLAKSCMDKISANQPKLAEIKARAGRDGYIQGIDDWIGAERIYENFNIELKASEYANQIRQQANPSDKINKARDEASSALQNWINEAGD